MNPRPEADPTEVHGLELMAYLGHGQGPCPYLPGRQSSLLFVDGHLTGSIYRDLLDKGYRRTGRRMYRPDCNGCNECKVIRVALAAFRKNKEQRRVWNRGQRLFEHRLVRPSYSKEKAQLYRRYLRYQHRSLEAPLDRDEYESFFVDSCLGKRTVEVQLLREGELVGVGILDVLRDAVSSMYFYFDPEIARFSPGTYSALLEMDIANEWGMPYYYLGYFIGGCAAMNYKARFRPCEIKAPDDEEWLRVESADDLKALWTSAESPS